MFPRLEKLNWYDGKLRSLSTQEVVSITRFNTLRSLKVTIWSEHVQHIRKLTQLRELSLTYRRAVEDDVVDAPVPSLVCLQNLKSLYLTNGGIYQLSALLGALPQVERLMFCQHASMEHTLSAAELPALQTLKYVEAGSFDIHCIQTLAQCEQLEYFACEIDLSFRLEHSDELLALICASPKLASAFQMLILTMKAMSYSAENFRACEERFRAATEQDAALLQLLVRHLPVLRYLQLQKVRWYHVCSDSESCPIRPLLEQIIALPALEQLCIFMWDADGTFSCQTSGQDTLFEYFRKQRMARGYSSITTWDSHQHRFPQTFDSERVHRVGW